MKNLSSLKPLLIVLAIIPLLATSRDDKSSRSTQNSIKVDEAPFNVVVPMLLGVSSNNEGHAYFNFTNGDFGNLKSLTVDFSYIGGGNVEGVYTFPENGTDRLLNNWLTEYTVFSVQEESFVPLQAGTVTVKHHGDNDYEIKMDLTMEDGTVINGTYRGDFEAQFKDK
ncbi:MAG TPA: hypothetical protein VD884_16215 [Ohtaekwangia sp.]|nr:hypothetical protein [Ohtaekwangia sp.]